MGTISFNIPDIMGILLPYVWAATRILGIFSTAPGFSNRAVPTRYRLLMGLAILVGVLPSLSSEDLFFGNALDGQGMVLLAHQFLIGMAIGLVMRLLFTGIEMAGELMGMTMGLGFAMFFDPMSQARTAVLGTFLSTLTLLLWFVSDLHLVLIEVLVQSFQSMPVENSTLSANWAMDVARLGSFVFSVALQVSLPVLTLLLLANLAFGVLTRAAPQLNLFGVGFPITLTLGFVVIGLTLPLWMAPILDSLRLGTALAQGLFISGN